MFGRFLSINPPQPELLIDISKEHKANSDYSDTGYPYITNYGSKGGGAAYACTAANLKSPELYYNPWALTSPNRCEVVELKTGVWHVTKLTPPSTDTYNSILFSCPVSRFKGVGNKFGIYVSKPEGKDFNSSARFYNSNDDTGELFFRQSVVEGMNIIDLSEVHENPNLFWRLKIPESFYNRDESGGLLETETDFYVIFFPVLDESNCNGYGEYLIPKFNSDSWLKGDNTTVSDDGLVADSSAQENCWALSYRPSKYYSDDYITVYSPEFLNISCASNTNIIAGFRGVIGGNTTEPISYQNIGKTTGTNAPFYGGAVFKESYASVYLQIYFSAVGEFTMRPYNNDRFTVKVSNTTNNYARLMISETEPFHDKCELKTLLTKYRNTYSGSSILYRNEVQSTTKDLLGIYGFRLSTYGENQTQYSHRHCICDAAQGRWTNLVSYCNNRIVTNEITDWELLYKDTVSAVVLLNSEVVDADCSNTGSLLFASREAINVFSGLLYYLVGFKERLTPWQIAYYIKQMN